MRVEDFGKMKDSSSRCLKASYYEHGVYTLELAIYILERHAAQWTLF